MEEAKEEKTRVRYGQKLEGELGGDMEDDYVESGGSEKEEIIAWMKT